MRKIVREKQVVLMLLAAVLVSMFAGAVMAKRLPSQGGIYEQLKSLYRSTVVCRVQLCRGSRA